VCSRAGVEGAEGATGCNQGNYRWLPLLLEVILWATRVNAYICTVGALGRIGTKKTDLMERDREVKQRRKKSHSVRLSIQRGGRENCQPITNDSQENEKGGMPEKIHLSELRGRNL